ncbi:hypothetical protein FLAN108750_01030 [Flavobacterium antarcticum]|uniref:hypothetical protein n=1 Tax=Flavobacterium antarcticum TaxID=271155 RepID=UPI0003B6E4A0|nr:hypothetical protein [Flavobacterium antarcticum]
MKTFYFSCLALFLFSCNSNDVTADNCLELTPAGIISVEPNLSTEEIENDFEVTFPVTNGCGTFESFKQTAVGNITTIEVIAKYEGCICTQDIRLLKSVYNFNQTTPGTYTLKFKMTDGTYTNETVIVE